MKVQLGKLVNVKTGKLDANASSINGEYPFFTCSKEPLKISTYSYDCECVLVAGNGDLNVKYYNGKFDAYQRTYIIEDNGCKKIYIPYLYYFMDKYVEKLRTQSIGGVIKYIKLANITDVEIVLPNFDMQRKIVDKLDKVNAVINKKKRQLENLDLLVRSLFIEMFGDPVENPKKWNISTLLTLGSCKNGMNFHIDDFGVEINCIGVGDFKDYDVISNTHSLPIVSLNSMPTEDYLLKDEDIVFVRSNGNKTMVGRSIVIYPGKNLVTFSGFCIRYRNEDSSIMVPYLLRVLKTESIRMQMYGRGANIQNLNQKILASLKIPIPPMNLQEKFVQSVSSIDKSKLAVKKSLEELEILKKSLMQKYFA